jgi:hypothetical protein
MTRKHARPWLEGAKAAVGETSLQSHSTPPAAAGMLPSNKPEELAAMGTDGQPISKDLSLISPDSGDVFSLDRSLADVMTDLNPPI